MKKFYLLLLPFFFLHQNLKAQNYQTVQNGVEQFFADSTGYIKAIRIASVSFNGTDSVYTNFFTMRDISNYDTVCLWVNGPSWLGKEVIIRNNGFNIFFNAHNDSIFINTLANLNDTFTFYTFSNGNYIEASVTAADTGTVVSFPDSVKTITLQAKDSSGNNISNSMNGRQIKFSKNHGFVQLPVFYDFPAAANLDYKRVNAHRLTWGEIYDYDVNDRFYYEYTYEGSQTAPPNYSVLKILSKSFSPNNDTVFYQIENTSINNEVDWNPQPHMVTTVNSYTTNSFYINLNKVLFNSYMPEESIVDTFLNYHIYNMSFIKCENRITESFADGGPGFDQSSGCYNYPMGVPNTHSYSNGLGEVKYTWYDDFNLNGGSTQLYGYTKGNITCGCYFVTGLQELSTSQLKIYPNPSSDLLFVERTLPNTAANLQLIDCYGRIVEEIKIQQGEKIATINVKAVASGYYFIRITDGEHSSWQKAIIQH